MKINYLLAVLLFTTTLFSCKQSHDNNLDHDHDEMLQLVTYNDNYEVFVEATPFVAGKHSHITLFISDINHFKPVDNATVTVTLANGTQHDVEIATPQHPGVYNCTITPGQKGEGSLTIDIDAAGIQSQSTIGNIEIFIDTEEAEHAAHEAHPHVDNAIVFNKSQSWKIDFATEEIERTNFAQVINTTAQIQPSAGDESVVTAKTSGVIIFQNNNVVPGTSVTGGQRLFSIDAAGMADNNLAVRFAEAESSFNRAKAEYERKTELAKDTIVSQSELIAAKTEYENARANFELYKQNFSAGKQAVASPMSGYITDLMVQNGQYVEAGQPVMRVAQNRNLYIKAELQPKYYGSLSSIESANMRVQSSQETYTLEELSGKMVSYGKSSDMNNPLIPVVFQVSNSANLLPGSFVELFIRLSSSQSAITIPNGAIIEEMGAYFAMVQVTPELFEKRAITTGATDGLRTVITSGISENERVVTRGAIFVKLAESADALDPHAGHMH